MKKQYIFLIMIGIILYILYLIISFTHKEYQINSSIEYIKKLNLNIEEKIITIQEVIEYKSSKAYKNKVLKEQQSYKNKGEKVIYLTSETTYNKYTGTRINKIETKIKHENKTKIELMNIYEKWKYLIFKKDTY